jgi:phosphate acetyltransferase
MKPVSKPEAHEKYQRLIDAAKAAGPVLTAVAHPRDEVSLKGVIEAARLHLIEPILVGPAERIIIRRIATQHEMDLSSLRIVDALHSHESAAKAVELARKGEAEALMNDDLDWTTDLGDAIVNQPQDVANVIQSLRAKAQEAGTLKTTKEQVVSTQKQDGRDW